MTLALDPQSIGQAVMGRLLSDSAGSTARAQLGTSSALSSFAGRTLAAFAIEQLPRVRELGIATVPCLWAAFDQGNAIGQARTEMRRLSFSWWVYDDPAQGAWRLNGFAPIIEALYSNLTIAHGRITPDLITNPTLDAHGMLAMRVRLSFSIFR